MFHGDRLTVSALPCADFDFDDLERLSECPIQLVLCDAAAVKTSIDKYYGSDVNIDSLLSSIDKNKVEIVEIKDREAVPRCGKMTVQYVVSDRRRVAAIAGI